MTSSHSPAAATNNSFREEASESGRPCHDQPTHAERTNKITEWPVAAGIFNAIKSITEQCHGVLRLTDRAFALPHFIEFIRKDDFSDVTLSGTIRPIITLTDANGRLRIVIRR